LRTAIALAFGVLAAVPVASADTALNVGKAQANADSIITVDVGVDQGIFQKHGLDLKILNFEGGSRIIQALTAGSLDLAVGAGTQMSFVVKGAPMKAVCEDTTTLPYFSVALPWDSPIHSLDELKGKKIGVSTPGSLTDFVAQELDRTKGWGPDGVTRVMVGGGITASTAAFRSHQIDAYIGGTTSFLAEAEKQAGRVLAPVSDFVGNMASGTIFASDHLIETNPDALRAFLQAWIETTNFILTDKEGTVKSWTKITGFSPKIMKGMFNASCRFDPESLSNLKRSFIALNLLDAEPDMSKLYTEAYLPK
jgi:ABC-type nitrate/sulfonate/bicarbonate transport system substrate-binding protein